MLNTLVEKYHCLFIHFVNYHYIIIKCLILSVERDVRISGGNILIESCNALPVHQ